MIDSDRFVTNFGPKNHATWPFLSMPWAVIRGWAIIQVWAINREFTVYMSLIYRIYLFKFLPFPQLLYVNPMMGSKSLQNGQEKSK